MTTTAPAIVRRAKTDRIGTILKQQKANPRIIRYGSEPALPSPEPTPLPGAGLPDTTLVLPSNPGGNSDWMSKVQFNPGQEWTTSPGDQRFLPDPAGENTGGFFRGSGTGSYEPPTDLGGGFRGGFTGGGLLSGSAAGPFPGGNMGGPQGSVYGINPVTGNTIYNVTGSPRPGFFDSRLGKFVQGVGSTALNMFVPGLGFVSSKIFDAARRANEQRNTGTDLSGRIAPPSMPSAPPGMTIVGRDTRNGQPIYRDANGKLFVNPGTGVPVGSGGPMTPGQYTQATFGGLTPTGYRDTAGSATFDRRAANAQLMSSQAFGGNPNRTGTFAKEGRFLLDAEGTPTQFGDQSPGHLSQQFRRPQGGPTPYASNQAAVNDWLRAQPAYRKFMQGRGG